MEDSISQTPMTFGQRAVGLNFNPSNDPKLDKVRLLIAEAIDILEDTHKERTDNERAMVSWTTNVFRTEAFNALTKASMSLVKYLTWKN